MATDPMMAHFVTAIACAPHIQFKPSEEHIRVVRLLIKRVHYFANGFCAHCPDSHLITITNTMRRWVLGGVRLLSVVGGEINLSLIFVAAPSFPCTSSRASTSSFFMR